MLVVDDHRGVVDRVAAMLADDFDVAGVATSGKQALETAPVVDPDVIVLDINMPDLNGFQTIRALQKSGSRSQVVFLSMLNAEEQVNEAFRLGGRGYVVKPYMVRDLLPALDHVLQGRVFVPSVTSLLDVANGRGHAVLLHDHLEPFLDDLADFFDSALLRGDATCVIAQEDIRQGLTARLRARRWDVGGPSAHPRYRVIDTAEALGRVMRDGMPDANVLAEIVAELDAYRLAAAEGATPRLTIFGNMAGTLSLEGHTEAAIALEHIWDRLTADRPFLTICGYAASCFHDAVPELWSAVCGEHWAVSHANGS